MEQEKNWKIVILEKDSFINCIAEDPEGVIRKTDPSNIKQGLSLVIQDVISCGTLAKTPLYDLCIIPDAGIDTFHAPDHILITSAGYSQLAAELFIRDEQLLHRATKKFDRIVETDEYIDRSGVIVKPLAESEINRVLRSLLYYKESTILIALANSHKNPVHEKTLLNLLRAAGYSSVIASHSLIPVY